MQRVKELSNTIVKESISLDVSVRRIMKVVSLAMGVVNISDIINVGDTVNLLVDKCCTNPSFSYIDLNEEGTQLYGVMFYGKTLSINGDCFFCKFKKYKTIFKYRLFSITVSKNNQSQIEKIKNEFDKWFEKFTNGIENLFDNYQEEKNRTIDFSFSCCKKNLSIEDLSEEEDSSEPLSNNIQSENPFDMQDFGFVTEEKLDKPEFRKIDILIGNNAESVFKNDRKMWDWCLYVKVNPEDIKYIKYIKIFLHETFKNPIHRLKLDSDNVFKSKIFNGWGVFVVDIKIFWNDVKCEDLNFSECKYKLNFNSITNSQYSFIVSRPQKEYYKKRICYKHVVKLVYPDSIFDKSNLRVGDEILFINNNDVKFLDNDAILDLIQSLHEEYPITILRHVDSWKAKESIEKKTVLVKRLCKENIKLDIDSLESRYDMIPETNVDKEKFTENVDLLDNTNNNLQELADFQVNDYRSQTLKKKINIFNDVDDIVVTKAIKKKKKNKKNQDLIDHLKRGVKDYELDLNKL